MFLLLWFLFLLLLLLLLSWVYETMFFAVATSVATAATAVAATSAAAAVASTAAISPPALVHTMSLLCFLAMSRNIYCTVCTWSEVNFEEFLLRRKGVLTSFNGSRSEASLHFGQSASPQKSQRDLSTAALSTILEECAQCRTDNDVLSHLLSPAAPHARLGRRRSNHRGLFAAARKQGSPGFLGKKKIFPI